MRAWLFALAMLGCASAEGDPIDPTTPRGPVIVELFTSQGCSSCPPADALLAQLATRPGIVPLSFHVDYWDGLGWADPYAKPAWTERQRQYARSLGDHRVYTPELVVGGATGMVGSQRETVERALARAPKPALLAARATWSTHTLAVTATPPRGTDVWVALYEERARNKVPRGENAGETLQHVHVVRALVKLENGTQTIALGPAWKNVRAVAFAADHSRVIVASAALAR